MVTVDYSTVPAFLVPLIATIGFQNPIDMTVAQHGGSDYVNPVDGTIDADELLDTLLPFAQQIARYGIDVTAT